MVQINLIERYNSRYMPTINLNNINIYYELHGEGAPLVMIHGLGSSTRDWEYQIDFFKKQFKILVFDLRGHGKTDKPETPYTVDLFASDAAALIQHIFPQGANVVGHSLGGMVAFQLTLDHPELVNTLTILNSAPAVIFPTIKSQLYFHLRSFDVRFFGMKHISTQLAKMLFPYPDQANLRQTFIERWCENDPKAYLNSLKAFRGWTVMHRLPSLTCPTLIITADRDYTPVTFKEFYTRMIPNAELVVIKNSGHISNVDQPEAFNNTLMNFLLKNMRLN